MDQEHDPTWPAALDVTEVRAWIAEVLPGRPRVVGPVAIHRANAWGLTARFAATAGSLTTEVVLKANSLPMSFTGAAAYQLLGLCCPGAVPKLLASVEEPGRRWELFGVFAGDIVGSIGELEPVVDVARTIASIQATVAACDGRDAADLPRTPVEQLSPMFDELMARVEGSARHAVGGQAQAPDQPDELSIHEWRTLAAARPAVAQWADELAARPWPLSIHHVDLHPNNAVRLPDGGTLIFDWEEADLGFPLFVLDKLLLEADRWWGEAGAAAVRAAYLDALPWADRAERERAFDVALLLSPIRYAHADLRFADAMGWEPHRQIASWLRLAVRRWETVRD